MKTKQSIITLTAGVLIGASMAGPVASAAEEYLQARRSTQEFFVDGQRVELEAYAIGGHNYVKLRDIGKAVDFSVSYDPFTNAAIIVSGMPYRDEQPATAPKTTAPLPASSTDYAAQASPSIFTEELTRQAYNGVRDTILHREEIIAGSYQPIPIGEVQRNGPVEQAAIALGRCPIYEIINNKSGQAVCNTRYVENYEPARGHTQSFIDGLSGLSDREKAELQKGLIPMPDHTEELAKIEQIFNELKPRLECGGARLRCLLDIEKKLREEVAEENFAAGLALGWEIRKELQDAGVLSTHSGEDSGTVIPEER